MKKRLWITLIVTTIVSGLCAYLLSKGVIRFNYPSESEFPVRGIDVSHHQGSVDWPRVAAAGIHFAYIKASEGQHFRDTHFEANWVQARRAGIFTGAYHFYSLCKTPDVQAANFLAAAPPERDTALPPAIDLEFGGNCAAQPSPEALRENLARFLKPIEKAWGRRAVLYVTADFYHAYIEGHFSDNRLWVRNVFARPRWAGFRRWDIWQYANRGHIKGIETFVDLNVYGETWPRFKTLIEPSPDAAGAAARR